MYMYMSVIYSLTWTSIILHSLWSLKLASGPGLPLTYVRVFIMRMRKTFELSSGKAWDDSSRENRTVVGQYLARAPWNRYHAGMARNFSGYQAFLPLVAGRAKSKTMGCWVRRRPLLSI